MTDPVILTTDGHTYERDAITLWLSTNTTSPCTGQQVTGQAQLVPNHALRNAIEQVGGGTVVPLVRTKAMIEAIPVADSHVDVDIKGVESGESHKKDDESKDNEVKGGDSDSKPPPRPTETAPQGAGVLW